MRSKKPNSNTTGPSTYHNDNVALDFDTKVFQALAESEQKYLEAETDEERQEVVDALFRTVDLSDFRRGLRIP